MTVWIVVVAAGSGTRFGGPKQYELLGSSRMAELITRVQGQYDKIVIDTPPVLPVTDAAVASAYAEAVVVVIRHGRTTRTQVANAASTLEKLRSIYPFWFERTDRWTPAS